MKSLTIILSSTCTKLLCTFLEKKPLQVFKMLQKEIEHRSIMDIYEGSYAIKHFQSTQKQADNDTILLVLKIKFSKTFQTANSESIWNCLKKFAYNGISKFSVKEYGNYQVIEFKNNIVM
jgi:hypothetical protein